METIEIFPLTEENVARLLQARNPPAPKKRKDGSRRLLPRWPFPGTVELWIPDGKGGQEYTLATSLDLSLHGVGIQLEMPLDRDQELAVAIHEPEASFHGYAVVRHCKESQPGVFHIGMQFRFDRS